MGIERIGIIPTPALLNEFLRSQTQVAHDDASKLADRLGVGGRLSDKENLDEILDADLQKERFAQMIKINSRISQKIDEKSQFITSLSSLASQFRQELMDVRSERPNPNFINKINQIFKALESALNNAPSLGGTSELYSTKCVDFSNMIVAPSATADYSYCIGGGHGTTVNLDPSGTTTDASLFTARDPLIEQFVRSIRLSLAGDPLNSRDQNFTDALDLLDRVEEKAMVAKEVILGQKKFIAERTSWMEKNYEHTKEHYEELSRASLSQLVAHISSTQSALDIQQEHTLRDLHTLKDFMDKTSRLI